MHISPGDLTGATPTGATKFLPTGKSGVEGDLSNALEMRATVRPHGKQRDCIYRRIIRPVN